MLLLRLLLFFRLIFALLLFLRFAAAVVPCYAYVPFYSLFCPFHRVFYFHFILMFTFIAYIYFFHSTRVWMCVCRFIQLYMRMPFFSCLFFFANSPLSTTMPSLFKVPISILFPAHFYLDYRHVVCDVLFCILITHIYECVCFSGRTQKTLVQRDWYLVLIGVMKGFFEYKNKNNNNRKREREKKVKKKIEHFDLCSIFRFFFLKCFVKSIAKITWNPIRSWLSGHKCTRLHTYTLLCFICIEFHANTIFIEQILNATATTAWEKKNARTHTRVQKKRIQAARKQKNREKKQRINWMNKMLGLKFQIDCYC